MHHVIFQRFAVNRLERAEANVQSQLADLHYRAREYFPEFLE